MIFLRRIREIPAVRSFLLPGKQIPNTKSGEPLPFELEVQALVKAGEVGNDPENNGVLIDEFFEVAPKIWNLTQEQRRNLVKDYRPKIEQWTKDRDDEFRQLALDIDKKKEGKSLFFLRTWDQARFEKLLGILSAVPESKVPNAQQLTERFKNLQMPVIKSIPAKITAALTIENNPQRLRELQALVDSISTHIQQLTYLTAEELDEITSNEEKKGYLYLDSFAAIYPQLYQTVQTVKTATVEYKTSAEVVALNLRQEALEGLVYGAKTNVETRSIIDKLTNRGSKFPSNKVGTN